MPEITDDKFQRLSRTEDAPGRSEPPKLKSNKLVAVLGWLYPHRTQSNKQQSQLCRAYRLIRSAFVNRTKHLFRKLGASHRAVSEGGLSVERSRRLERQLTTKRHGQNKSGITLTLPQMEASSPSENP